MTEDEEDKRDVEATMARYRSQGPDGFVILEEVVSGSTSSGNSLQEWIDKNLSKQDDCPHCGRCKHCGRGGSGYYYPTYPWYPSPYTPYPYNPWPTWTVSTSSYTVSDNAQQSWT